MRFRNCLIPLALGAMLAGAAPAQDCVDYAAGVHVVASVPHAARHVAVGGNYVYLSSHRVVDVAVPGAPTDLGDFAGPDGVVVDMLVADGRLYAAYAPGAGGTFGGLAIFDLSTQAAPTLAGAVATPGIATALAAGGGRAYVRSDDGYVHVIDAASAVSPQLLGSFGAGAVTAFDASGTVVYAFDRVAAMVKVFNAANGAAPQLWTSWPAAGVEDVELAFGRLHVFAGGSYRSYTLADPLSPVFAQVLPAIDRVVDFQGQQAAAFGFPAVFWDLADPLSPAPLATVPFVTHAGYVSGTRALVGISDDFCELALGDGGSAGATGGFDLDQGPTGLAVLGSHALVIKEMGLDVIDATDCASPARVASLLVPGMNDGYAVVGDWLYILVRTGIGSSLQVVDLRDPANPVDVALLPVAASRLVGLAASGNWLYTARGSVLVPIDVTDPAAPVVGAGLSGLGFGPVAAAAGDLLVAANDWEVRTFSLATPGAPALVGVLPVDVLGRKVLLDGAVACVLGDDGIALFDVSDPAAIAPRGALAVPGSLDGMALAAHRLYVEGNGIHVVDVSDPAAPAFVGSLPYGSDTFAPLAVVGQCLWFTQYVSPGRGRVHTAPLACAAGGGGGGGGGGNEDDPLVVAIDIKPGSRANPIQCRHPRGIVPVAILTTPGFDALTVDHASVRFGPGQASEAHVEHRRGDRGRGRGHDHDHGIAVPRRHEEDVDCDGDVDLLLHFRLEDADIPCGATDAVLTGLTFDGREVTGKDLVSTRPPCDDKGRGHDCDDKGRGDRDDGDRDDGDHDDGDDDRCSKSLAAAGKAAPVAEAPALAPNPFNPQTRVSFALAQPGRVTVAVYDLSGRRVALVADAAFEAGRHEVPWDGRDDAGLGVASGVYFVRVEGAGEPVNLRAVLLR